MDTQIFFDAGLAWGIFLTLVGALTAIQGMFDLAKAVAWTGLSITALLTLSVKVTQ
jgi:hypothetical protein